LLPRKLIFFNCKLTGVAAFELRKTKAYPVIFLREELIELLKNM
jgi:hypothetical protein